MLTGVLTRTRKNPGENNKIKVFLKGGCGGAHD